MNHRGPCDATESAECVRSSSVLDLTVIAELRKFQKPEELDFVTELIHVFIDELTGHLSQIKTGLESLDAQLVSQAAHALKGASGELGAQGMREICSRLELNTSHGSLDGAHSMMLELEAETKLVRNELVLLCVDVSAKS